MRELSRRALLGWAGASVLASAGCTVVDRSFTTAAAGTSAPATTSEVPQPPPPPPPPPVRLIGDGSTADTGPQPHPPVPQRVLAGPPPPQFVVFSWDGAANLSTGQFPRFRTLAQELGASMTFFLSGLYALPEDQRMQYAPPRHPVGASDIGYLSTQEVLDTMSEVRLAWLDG